ncbi:MAG: hypothetical protein AB7F89_06945 [Pirellulaceae bacterium]
MSGPSARVRYLVCSLGAALSFVTAPVPAQIAAFPGELVVTSADGVPFGMRSQPMVTLPRGTEIRVTEVRGRWVGGFTMLDGRKQLGWIRDSEVMLAPPPGDTGTQDDPAAVALLRELGVQMLFDDQQQVRQVDASESRCEGQHLAQLRRLPHLLYVDLTGVALQDEDLRHLADCRGLQKLYLSETGITDDGLRHLRSLLRLEVLAVPKTKVTGKGLKLLEPLADLRVLNLGHCAVRDEDLKALAAFPRLETLALPHTLVTDAGLEHIRPVSLLRVLNLEDTPVTGAGFAHLRGLTELRMLYVRRCPVDAARVDQLDDDIPGLAIYD